MFKIILNFVKSTPLLFLIYLPGPGGVFLRRWFYSKKFRRCGNNLWVGTNVHIFGFPLIEVGDNVIIRENVQIRTSAPRKTHEENRDIIELTPYDQKEKGVIQIGNGTDIGFGAILLGYGCIKIGKFCGIGPGALILSETFHHQGTDPNQIYKYTANASPKEQCVMQGLVELGDGTGVAAYSIVLPGAVLGENSWLAPNSLVRFNGQVEDHVVAKGNPAITVSKRPSPKSEE